MNDSSSQIASPAGVVAVVRRLDKFLVIRRSAQVIAPRMICFPGGGVQIGEEEPAALCRELREELAVDLAYPTKCVWRNVSPRGVRLAWWATEIPEHVVLRPNPDEVEEFFWSSASELLPRADLLPTNRHFLELLARLEITLEN